MQCVLLYGRLLSRAVASGLYNINSSANSKSVSSAPSVQDSAFNRIRLRSVVSGFSKNNPFQNLKNGRFGDDAYFVASHALGDVIGVADGVGGWRAWGIDPGEFSSSLMSKCENIVQSGVFTTPAELLSMAYSEMETDKDNTQGSSTACLVVVQAKATDTLDTVSAEPSSSAISGILSSANIGDSGYLVVRKGRIVHRSHEQQHYFNTPFQLSLPPPGTSEHVLSDSPSSAELREFEVKAGDLVLVATDGVFDNLPIYSILKVLRTLTSNHDTDALQLAANTIAQKARAHAFDEEFMSPFAISARQSGINTKGGKPDDITVVLATVVGPSS